MFNPETNNCTESLKLAVKGKCQSYKQCLVIDSVSPFAKWTEYQCSSGQHFDSRSQKCIDIKNSSCGNFCY